jgi:outer membrane protein assembly factor BamB
VYFGTGDSRRFVALDARTGAVVATWPFNWYLFSSPVVVEGTLLIGSTDGNLYALR